MANLIYPATKWLFSGIEMSDTQSRCQPVQPSPSKLCPVHIKPWISISRLVPLVPLVMAWLNPSPSPLFASGRRSSVDLARDRCGGWCARWAHAWALARAPAHEPVPPSSRCGSSPGRATEKMRSSKKQPLNSVEQLEKLEDIWNYNRLSKYKDGLISCWD